jgi:hypothetical protein
VRRRWPALIAVLAALGVLPASAAAHGASPDTASQLRGLDPAVPGLTVSWSALQLELVNRTGKTVVVDGYQGEPYAQLLPDGTVRVNQRSPATYLNRDAQGTAPVPASARADAPPRWAVVGRDGRFRWHDHRAHYMGTGTPSQVRDATRTTRLFDYAVPITVGGRPVRIEGTVTWVGRGGGGLPPAAPLMLGLTLAVGAGVVLASRRSGRRRRPAAAGSAW